MKVLTFSRQFPKGHPKAGQPTWFVEKILICLNWGMTGQELLESIKPEIKDYANDFALITEARKYHTIRAGSRWKTGDMASLRVWSDKPYRSKQIEFAQVEVKKVWDIEIYQNEEYWIFTLNGIKLTWDDLDVDQFVDDLAKNDGLTTADFLSWFSVHPKKKEQVFRGQIICWNETITY